MFFGDDVTHHQRESGVPGGVPGGDPGGVLDGVPSGVPGGVLGGVPGGVPRGVPGGVPRGDPSGDPAEVYNCRCTMIAIVEGVEEIAKSVGEYQPRMTYGEWEKVKDGR